MSKLQQRIIRAALVTVSLLAFIANLYAYIVYGTEITVVVQGLILFVAGYYLAGDIEFNTPVFSVTAEESEEDT